jgi:thioredoxin reductase (NADPH)
MLERVSVAIIGGGPAGLTAAIYLARAGIGCTVFEPAAPGGMVFRVHQIENYPGFPEGITGRELAGKIEAQAKRFGVEILQTGVKKVHKAEKEFLLELESGARIAAAAVIVATGCKPKKLGIKGEEELFGRGVSYCATCDGNFFRGQDVAVIGGGDSALQEALYLSQICRTVYVVHRRKELRAKKILEDRCKEKENLKLELNVNIHSIIGEDAVRGLQVADKERGKERVIAVSGIFFYVGMDPVTGVVRGLVKVNEAGFIEAGEDTQTSVPGIFAVGDVRSKRAKQVASAVADGCNASFAIEEYFLEQK